MGSKYILFAYCPVQAFNDTSYSYDEYVLLVTKKWTQTSKSFGYGFWKTGNTSKLKVCKTWSKVWNSVNRLYVHENAKSYKHPYAANAQSTYSNTVPATVHKQKGQYRIHGSFFWEKYQNMTYHLQTATYYQGRRQCIQTLKNMILTT